jgi:hypothetical protein
MWFTEGDSSLTTPDDDSVVQHLKREPIEGDSSKFTLTFYIEQESIEGDSSDSLDVMDTLLP